MQSQDENCCGWFAQRHFLVSTRHAEELLCSWTWTKVVSRGTPCMARCQFISMFEEPSYGVSCQRSVCHLKGLRPSTRTTSVSCRVSRVVRFIKHSGVDWWALNSQQLHVIEVHGRHMNNQVDQSAPHKETKKQCHRPATAPKGNDAADELAELGAEEYALKAECVAKDAHERRQIINVHVGIDESRDFEKIEEREQAKIRGGSS